MVVIENDLAEGFTSSSQIHDNTIHNRFHNLPPIKHNENRGTLEESQQNRDKYIHKRIPSNRFSFTPHSGIEPSIISSVKPVEEPALLRRSSTKIKRQNRRFMKNIKEAKNQFFYPVNAPRRRRSRFGKYRSSFELKATMDYISQEDSIIKELGFSQFVESYKVSNKDLYQFQPKLSHSTKAITFDSNDNIIIYTPNSTHGKNSVITNAEQRLDRELLKLNVYKKEVKLPVYKIPRPYYNRYDTIPLTRYPSLIRTRSLPAYLKEENIEALWNLYLRRVLCGRIIWRLAHSSQPNLVKDQYEKIKDEKINLANQTSYKHTLDPDVNPLFMSPDSSVDTGFFVGTELNDDLRFPEKNKSISSEYLSALENAQLSADDPQTGNNLTRQGSYISDLTASPVSPRRQAMFDSLEQLIEDVSSTISNLE